MAELLELAQLYEWQRVAQVDVWGCWIDTQLDAQRLATGQLLSEFLFADDLCRSALEDFQRFGDVFHRSGSVMRWKGTVNPFPGYRLLNTAQYLRRSISFVLPVISHSGSLTFCP